MRLEDSTRAAARADTIDFGGLLAGVLPSGVQRTLAYLNARTRFRFTGLYRLDGTALNAVCEFDRENPMLHCVPRIPAPAECYQAAGLSVPQPPDGVAARVRRNRALVSAARAGAEQWRADIPLRHSTGQVAGVLSYCDRRPRLLVDAERERLASTATMLAAWLTSAAAGRAHG